MNHTTGLMISWLGYLFRYPLILRNSLKSTGYNEIDHIPRHTVFVLRLNSGGIDGVFSVPALEGSCNLLISLDIAMRWGT